MQRSFVLLCVIALGFACSEDGPTAVTLNGAVNKGPFVTGSSVDVSPVNGTGNPTGDVYSTQTINDLGEFSVDFTYNGYASLEGMGFYYNEVTGQLSGANLTLRAFYEVTTSGTQDAYINIVTHLTYNRVKNLITSGTSFADAIVQAEGELKDAMAICPPNFDPAASGTDMNISGGDTDANAYLFAVSAVVAQAATMREGESVDANLQEIVNTYASDLEADGALNSDKVEETAAAVDALDVESVMDMLADRLNDVGSSAVVPDLYRVLDVDGDGFVGDDDCAPVSSGTWTANPDGDEDGHEHYLCGGDDCIDVAEGFYGEEDCEAVKVVSAGGYHACALLLNGAVKCWGHYATGGEYLPTVSNQPLVTLSSGYSHDCGIDTNNHLSCWGDELAVESTPIDTDFLTISAGGQFSCGVRTDASTYCWGDADYGETNPPDIAFVTVSAGGAHACGIDNYGAATCWGTDSSGESTPPEGIVLQSVSSGSSYSCGIQSDDQVACWGDAAEGGNSPPDDTFINVSVGGEHSCGVREDGTLACWGANANGQASPPSGEFLEVSCGNEHTCGLRADSTIECWGYNDYGQCDVPADL